MKKKTRNRIIFILFVIVFFNIWLIYSSICPKIPKVGSPPILYSNQCRQDLKTTLIRALENARHKIHIVTFGLTDPAILRILDTKSKEPLFLKVYYDAKASPPISIGENQVIGLKNKGLVHQKLLVIDDKIVFLGSANLTRSSLMMHDNLVIGLYSPEIATFLQQKTPFYSSYLKAHVGSQEVELFLLPDIQNKALFTLKRLIRSATDTIDIAMFTLTHPILVEEIIRAHKKGIRVGVHIDKKSSLGASAKAVEKLEKEHVPVFTNQKISLFHHKFLYVDKKHLAVGSANWTKSAFAKNNDCFIILYNLRKDQKKFMEKLKHVISLEAVR